jgi:hypothetical protein
MTSQYFEKFPEISYNGVRVRDISRRANFLKQTINNPYVFLPYTIEEGDRAEDVAYYYYGDPNYVWLVYLANNITDPYHQWPFDEETFHNYIIDKYAQQSGKVSWEVVDWSQNMTIEDNIVYYYKKIDNTLDIVKLSPESFRTLYLRAEDNIILRTEFGRKIVVKKLLPEEWIPYRIYEYEQALNENKRNIFLIDRNYLSQVEKELKDKLR